MKLGKKEFGLLLLNCLFSIFGGLFTVAFTHYASQILNAVEEGNGDLMAKMLVGAVIAMMLRFAFWVLDSITEMKFLAPESVRNSRFTLGLRPCFVYSMKTNQEGGLFS